MQMLTVNLRAGYASGQASLTFDLKYEEIKEIIIGLMSRFLQQVEQVCC